MAKLTKFPKEKFKIYANGHTYYITHFLATDRPRTNNLWVVSRDSQAITKAKVFKTKADMLKHYPNLRGKI